MAELTIFNTLTVKAGSLDMKALISARVRRGFSMTADNLFSEPGTVGSALMFSTLWRNILGSILLIQSFDMFFCDPFDHIHMGFAFCFGKSGFQIGYRFFLGNRLD